MKYKAVIFDLDETLMPEESSVKAAFEQTCEPAAAKHSLDAAALAEALRLRTRELWRASPVHPWCQRIGISSWEALSGDLSGKGDGLAALRQWMAKSGFRVAAWQKALGDFGVDDEPLARGLAERLVEVRAGYHVLYPKTEGVLAALRGNCRLGLLSNGPPATQRAKLKSVGLCAYFDAIVISGEVGVGKPDTRAFELTLNRLAATPAESVMVGDSLARDIAGANAAGITSIWVNRRGESLVQGIEPGATICDLNELAGLLK